MTVLAATDRSDNSRAALRTAARLAEQLGEQLVVASVFELWERDISTILPTFEDVELEVGDQAREEIERFVAETLPDIAPLLHLSIGHPAAERILEAADEVDASMIVVGTSGSSRVTEAFFGSTVSALARRSRHPVIAVPPHWERRFARVLAPVDFSLCSEHSLAFAANLTKRLGARLWVQHSTPLGTPAVAPPLIYIPEAPDFALRAAQERLIEMLETAGIRDDVQQLMTDVGPPHADILRAVDEHDIDLVVMGTHGRSGLERFFLGSTAERMLRDRTCPVCIVRDVRED